MHRAQPVISKICKYKYDQDQNERLNRRIARVKANIDNKPPPVYPHLQRKAKKEQLMEERYTKIERENRILLQKMSHIMTHNVIDNQNKIKSRSLNAGARRRELERIMQENQSLLKRIQRRKPTFSKKVWKRHQKEHESYLKSMRDTNPRSIIRPKVIKSSRTAKRNKQKAHKLNPMDHGGFSAYAKGPTTKASKSGRKENRAKAAENVIYKEGRLIDDQYVIVTVIENVLERVFSFRTYALETSHQHRVDISAMDVRDVIDDDSLLRPDKHDELALTLIPRLRFRNNKLEFDFKAQNSESYEKSKKVAADTAQRILAGKKSDDSKNEYKYVKTESASKDIQSLVEETDEKLAKQITLSNKNQMTMEDKKLKTGEETEEKLPEDKKSEPLEVGKISLAGKIIELSLEDAEQYAALSTRRKKALEKAMVHINVEAGAAAIAITLNRWMDHAVVGKEESKDSAKQTKKGQ
mmetsp:Transcript_25423/g.45177  ORF Transcript_25423/g.45177 Transcript_25423/m.45177 type:complete len:468 (+) Transcript_25423:178-1581(+)